MILNAACEFFFCETRCDVLRAVPVVPDNRDDNDALDPCGVDGAPKFGFESGIFTELNDAGMTYYFESRLMRVIHKEQSHPIVRREIAGGDVLLVSRKICKRQGALIQHMKEPGRSTATTRY